MAVIFRKDKSFLSTTFSINGEEYRVIETSHGNEYWVGSAIDKIQKVATGECQTKTRDEWISYFSRKQTTNVYRKPTAKGAERQAGGQQKSGVKSSPTQRDIRGGQTTLI